MALGALLQVVGIINELNPRRIQSDQGTVTDSRWDMSKRATLLQQQQLKRRTQEMATAHKLVHARQTRDNRRTQRSAPGSRHFGPTDYKSRDLDTSDLAKRLCIEPTFSIQCVRC